MDILVRLDELPVSVLKSIRAHRADIPPLALVGGDRLRLDLLPVPVLLSIATARHKGQLTDAVVGEWVAFLGEVPPAGWENWLKTMFPAIFSHGFAPHHRTFWDWVWTLQRGVRPAPYVYILARGGGKSVSTETAAVRVGAERIRDYAWYCCETQDQADKHLDSIAEMLESSEIETYYPELGERKLGKYGTPKAWRRNRLATASGFTVDAIGLDTGVRGARVKESRPGLIIFDDVDGKHDSAKTTRKKVEIMTTSILPAGTTDCIVLFCQNLITPDSIASQLCDGRADFVLDRIVEGPHPAIHGLTYEQREVDDKQQFVITGGTATWAGQDLEICQEQINTWGISAFLQEAQHEVDAPPGGMFDHLEYRHIKWDDLPDLVRTVVWVDPAVSTTDQSDAMGIQADALGEADVIYRLWSWEQVTTPEDAVQRAILKAVELGAEAVGIETDQGGDTWRPTFNWSWDDLIKKGKIKRPDLCCECGYENDEWEPDTDQWDCPECGQQNQPVPKPALRFAKAGAGQGSKVERAARMLADYERGNIVHVEGTHVTLERALNRFPLTKPYDLTDAAYWSWNDLRNGVTMDWGFY